MKTIESNVKAREMAELILGKRKRVELPGYDKSKEAIVHRQGLIDRLNKYEMAFEEYFKRNIQGVEDMAHSFALQVSGLTGDGLITARVSRECILRKSKLQNPNRALTGKGACEMTLKTRRFDGGDLRKVLIGMVTDNTVCSRVASQWQPGGLFDSRWANLIGGWCVKYMNKYGEPPNGKLQGLFESWAEENEDRDKDTVKLVEKFLQAISDEYADDSERNSDYLIDVAGKYLNKVRLEQEMEQATEELERGNVDDAYNRLTGIARVEMGTGALVKPAEDYDVWRQAFDYDRRKPLVTYPGDLGGLVGNALTRDCLIAFMGPDKVGKSWWLLDLAYRGVRGRYRVAYIEAGDLCQDDVIVRLGQRTARQPLQGGWIERPTGFDKDYNVEKERKEFEELTPGQAYKAFRKITRGKDLFRLICHPNSSINVTGISSLLSDWEREGWVPDLVVIDYSDILAPPAGVRETLDQIDGTWKQLRRLSQELHCLVVTATQANASAYAEKGALLSRKHFSGRKTKLAHVNGMLALNVNSKDKEQGVTRVNWVVRRSGAYSENKCVHVAGCLALGCPVLKSAF